MVEGNVREVKDPMAMLENERKEAQWFINGY